MRNVKKEKNASHGSRVAPPPLKERPHENVYSAWLEMIISVGFSGIFYLLLFVLVLSLVPEMCLVRERVVIDISKLKTLQKPEPKQFSVPT